MLEQIRWASETEFALNGHRFTFVSHKAPGGMVEPPEDGFNVYKSRTMLDDYDRLLTGVAPIDAVVELGMFHGGSAALFHELLQPRRLVCFDLAAQSPSAHFDRYVAANPAIDAWWGVDQADRATLMAKVGDGPLDLVIDDASHDYYLTAASFDALFPLVRPGGLYVIEDWSWPFEEVWAEDPHLRWRRSLSDILLDLAGLMVARPQAIGRLGVFRSFVAIERGPATIAGDLALTQEPYRRSDHRRNARRRTLERLLQYQRRAATH